MRKESYKVKNPKEIIFGDPMYFEEFTGRRLDELIVDFKPPQYFEARVILTEQPMEEYPEFMEQTMTLYLAPEQTLKVYMDGCMCESQEIKEKVIGVDTARYLIQVDEREEILHTGGDGYWGSFQEITHKHGNRRILDAAILSIVIPDSENFEGMKKLMEYLFEDAKPIKKKKRDKQR